MEVYSNFLLPILVMYYEVGFITEAKSQNEGKAKRQRLPVPYVSLSAGSDTLPIGPKITSATIP